MLKNNQFLSKLNLYYIGLVVLTIFSLQSFWKFETNEIFRLGIGLLAIFSFWRVYLDDKGPLVYLLIFIDSTLLFRYTANQAQILASIVGVFLTFILILFLFSYHYAGIFKKANNLFISFASLASLMVSEVFLILLFFPIEPESKAILVVLFAWLIDEIISNFELKKLSKGFLVTVIAIFLVIFGTLALVFPFKIGF